MRAIKKDYQAIYEYWSRRKERLDGKRLDDEWKTIKGTHVMVDNGGLITKGPERLRSLGFKGSKEIKIGSEMRSANSDYNYSEGDSQQDWVHKNIKKLQPIYNDGGGEAIDSEWYKFRMGASTKDLHEVSKDEADEAIYDSTSQSTFDGWFRSADSSYKPKLTEAITSSPEVRNAALNLAYENYKNSTDNPLGFEDFLVTPIKVYRGENGQKHIEDDVFDAYSFDKKTAEYFAGHNGKVTEAEIRPIDTYGSMRAVGEAEIWVPREISPTGSRGDSADIGFERYNPIKWIFEDYENEEGTDAIDSIVQEAEVIKLFASGKGEINKKITERCIDALQRGIKRLMMQYRESNADSAFFAGELSGKVKDDVVTYPERKIPENTVKIAQNENDNFNNFDGESPYNTNIDNEDKYGTIKDIENEDDFDESKHPRDDKGQFSGNGGMLPPITKEELAKAIKAGKISKKVDTFKQNKHRKGSEKYKSAVAAGNYVSYLDISDDEVQKIVKEKAGTGKPYGNGNQYKETIDAGKIVGTYLDRNGKESKTSYLTIHYSKSGCHVVPAMPRRGKRNG